MILAIDVPIAIAKFIENDASKFKMRKSIIFIIVSLFLNAYV